MGFKSLKDIPHECTFCDLRHEGCGHDYTKGNETCEYFQLGGCFTCKLGGYNGADELNIDEGKPCVMAMIYDYERCTNYKKDKALVKEWKAIQKRVKPDKR